MQNNVKPLLDKTTSSNKIEKTTGETKHFSPATIEWRNSIYAYNKNTVKSLAAKDKLANNILRSYLNFMPISKNNTKSKRMRDLLRRNSTSKFFVSRPEIKQTSGKVIVTCYTANRENQLLLRKISFFNRSYDLKTLLALQNLYEKENKMKNFLGEIVTKREKNNLRYVHDLVSNSDLLENSSTSSAYAKIKLNNLQRFSHIDIRKEKFISERVIRQENRLEKTSNLSSKNMFLNNKLKPENHFWKTHLDKTFLTSLVRKHNSLKSMFFYSFLKWSLTMLNIKIRLFKHDLQNKNLNKPTFMIYYLIIQKGLSSKGLMFKKFSLDKVNIMLLQFLFKSLQKVLKGVSSPITLEKWIYFLFKYFKALYYKAFVKKYLKKEILAYNHLFMYSLNKLKFDKFIPGLKLLINKIYNKKVELNFVNLKYIQLNSDIFTESIAIKLRNKTLSLLKVFKTAIKFVKPPVKIKNEKLSITNDKLNKPQERVIFNEKLSVFLEKMYSPLNNLNKLPIDNTINSKSENEDDDSMLISQKSQNVYSQAKKLSVLNSLKYKWITGARFEGKGRLTRRFTAARSLFKFKHKGNLKFIDLQNSLVENSVDSSKRTPKTIMLRNQIKPNIQYSFVNSKRRIGAFGVKGWISSN